MEVPFYVKFLAAQAAGIGIVVAVLKAKLDRLLMNSAIRYLELWDASSDGPAVKQVVIISHKTLRPEDKTRILTAINQKMGRDVRAIFQSDGKIYGGLIVKIEGKIVNLSVRERLRQAGF